MKFDLELAKKGHPVQTRDGRAIRIICYDRYDNRYPIIALIKNDNDENIETYTLYGGHCIDDLESCYDLEMVPIEKEYFVNVYQTFSGIIFAGNIFTSEYLAKESLRNNCEKFIRTISFKI